MALMIGHVSGDGVNYHMLGNMIYNLVHHIEGNMIYN